MKRFPGDFQVRDGIWRSRGGETTRDAGGNALERRLGSILEDASDLSSESIELAVVTRDREAEHCLSPLRSNLLRVLDLREGSRVLELGCGCGAITRYLGEAAGRVVAVEESPARALLARLRCRDLDNVDVVSARIEDTFFDDPFDVVTIVGGLDRAGLRRRSPGNAFEGMLRFALENLSPDGVLVLAIQNKLGMKYFSGCTGDLPSRLFHGIEGYPDPDGRRTFGRQELLDLARRCGFSDFELLLPFPDYKLPSTFVNARFASAADCAGYNLADWCREPFIDYRGKREHLFSDQLALASVAATGLLADFSNSFLLLASREPFGDGSAVRRPRWIARGINILRRPEYRTVTTLAVERGVPTISKKRTHDLPPSPDSPVALAVDGIHPYVAGGKSLFMEMLRAIRRMSGGAEEFSMLVARWVDLLRQDRIPGADLLPSGHLDCLPSNLILDPDGALHYIDEEWLWNRPVPMDWVLFRGLLQFWRKNRPWIDLFMGRMDAGFEEFLARALKASGTSIGGGRIHELADMEAAFHWATSPLPPLDFRKISARKGMSPGETAAGRVRRRPSSGTHGSSRASG